MYGKTTAEWFEYAGAYRIVNETELTEIVVCGERAYRVPKDIADELHRLRAGWNAALKAGGMPHSS